MNCPICGSSKFEDRCGRQNARCKSCKAMERTRLLCMVLITFDVLKPNIKILHLEPEPALMKIFSELSPNGYYPFTRELANYDNNKCKIYKLDSSKDIDKFPQQSFDLIIHNHFLETVPFPVKYTLNAFSQMLKPHGYHFFTTFIEKGLTEEELTEISDQERSKRFGQSDRFYKFGRDDFIPLLQDLWGTTEVYIRNELTFSLKEYLDAALPEQIFNIVTPSTIFCQIPKNVDHVGNLI